jgi:DNA-damage-inducible protein D
VGLPNLEKTHFDVGLEVRQMVQKNVGKNPENLEQERQLPEIKKELKQGYRKMLKEDTKKKEK